MKTKLPSLLLALTLCLPAGGAAFGADPSPSVIKVAPADVSQSYVAEGAVEAVRSATVAAQVQGRILEASVDAGSRVAKGQVLMKIDAAEVVQVVAAAKAQVAQAEANAVNAKAQYERTRNLTQQHFLSQAALDQAQAANLAAQAQLRAAQAGLQQAMTSQGYTAITAPMAGLVSDRLADPGDMAQPGKPLVNVYDPSALRAVADVPESRIPALRQAGLKAKVEFPESGRWVDGVVVTVLPASDARTHTVQIRVDLPADLQGVRPGTYARVHFATGEAARITIPASAVLRRSELTGVYVADGKGGWSLRQVRVGETRADGQVEVMAGLKGGEEVATDPVKAGLSR